MKALLRAAMTAALLAIFMFVLPVGAFAEGNGYGHCINAGNPGHQGDDSNGNGHAADGGECETQPAGHDDDDDDDDTDGDGNFGGNSNANGGNAGGNGDNAGGNDDDVNKHGDDMPGRGLGHCKNYPNNGHDAAEEHGRGHLRDGGECDDERTDGADDDDTDTNGDDTTGDDDDDDDDGRDDDDDGRAGDDDDDVRSAGGDSRGGDSRGGDDDDDDGRIRAAGEAVMPIGFVDDDGDGFDDTTGMTLPEVQAFNSGAADTLGEVAAAGGLTTPVLAAAGPVAAAATTPTPGRIDAGLGWFDLSAGQNPLALAGMAAALTLALAYLMRRGACEA